RAGQTPGRLVMTGAGDEHVEMELRGQDGHLPKSRQESVPVQSISGEERTVAITVIPGAPAEAADCDHLDHKGGSAVRALLTVGDHDEQSHASTSGRGELIVATILDKARR